MSVGTAFHPRTSPLNRKMQWREWSGYFASSVYADAHDIEYNAIREAAALIDVSPLYKYLVSGPDALRAGRPGRHPRRDEAGRRRRHLHAVVRRARQGRRRRHDPPPRRAAVSAGRPPTRSSAGCARTAPGSTSTITEETEATAALALQGPLSRDVLEAATGESFADLRYFRRRGRPRSARSRSTCRGPATPATSATSCGSRPRARSRSGTRSMAAGGAYGIRPAGMLALDVVRLEAGLDPARGRLHLGPPRDEPRAELLARRDRPRPAGQLRQGRLRRPARARARSAGRRSGAAAGRPPARLVRHRGPVRRPGPAAGDQPVGRSRTRSRCSPAAARSAGRRATAGARSSSRRSRSPRCAPQHEALGTNAERRMDGRGPAWPGRRDRSSSCRSSTCERKRA